MVNFKSLKHIEKLKIRINYFSIWNFQHSYYSFNTTFNNCYNFLMAPHRCLCFNLQFSWMFDMVFGSFDCDRTPLRVLKHVSIRTYETWRKWVGCVSSNFTSMHHLMTSFTIRETVVFTLHQCTIRSLTNWSKESQCFAHLEVIQDASFVVYSWIHRSIAFYIFYISTPNTFAKPPSSCLLTDLMPTYKNIFGSHNLCLLLTN